MPVSDKIRDRLETQGFVGVCRNDSADLGSIELWLRFSPTVCLAGVIVGTMFAYPTFLAGFALIAAFGVVFPNTPFDYLYNYLIRPLVDGPKLPTRKAPSRSACFVGMLWFAAIWYAFTSGMMLVGYALGAIMTVVVSAMAFQQYCIASVLYRRIFGWSDIEDADNE